MDSLATGLKFGLRDLGDDEGRPLLESDASARLAALVATERRTCPYPGSRHQHGKPMNVSALKQMRAHWDEVLALLAFCRTLAAAPGQVGPAHLGRVWRAANVAALLAPYLHFRARQAMGDGMIPAPIAALFKVALGIVGPLTVLISGGRGHADLWSTLVRAEALHAHFEAEGSFIGRWEVCAGPAPMILEVLATLIDGGAGGPSAALARVLPPDEHAALRRVADVCGAFRIADVLFRSGVLRPCSALLSAARVEAASDPLRGALIAALERHVPVPFPELVAVSPGRLGPIAAEMGADAGAILVDLAAAMAGPPAPAEHDDALAAAVDARTPSASLRAALAASLRDYLALEGIFARAAVSGWRALSGDLRVPSGADREFVPTWPILRDVLVRCLGLRVRSRDGEIVLEPDRGMAT